MGRAAPGPVPDRTPPGAAEAAPRGPRAAETPQGPQPARAPSRPPVGSGTRRGRVRLGKPERALQREAAGGWMRSRSRPKGLLSLPAEEHPRGTKESEPPSGTRRRRSRTQRPTAAGGRPSRRGPGRCPVPARPQARRGWPRDGCDRSCKRFPQKSFFQKRSRLRTFRLQSPGPQEGPRLPASPTCVNRVVTAQVRSVPSSRLPASISSCSPVFPRQ